MNARIALLPGDGVGPEVTSAARLVLERVATVFGHQFTFDSARDRRGGAAPRQRAAARRHRRRVSAGRCHPARRGRRRPVRQPSAKPAAGGGAAAAPAAARPLREPASGQGLAGLENVGPLKPEVLARHRHARRSRAHRWVVLRRAARDFNRRRSGLEHDALFASRGRADRPRRVRRGAAAHAPRHLGRQGQRARNLTILARCRRITWQKIMPDVRR